MTGHLVLSTLHTNNAPAALVRLIEMGIPPFLLPGAVTLIIAQRLVRKVCQQCKEEYAPDANMINLIKEIISKNPKTKNYQVPAKLWRGKGCVSCNNTGFSGRLPIAEVFTPSSSVEEMVLKKNPLSQIYQKVVLEGMVTMAQDGMIKVIQGLTTPEEVLRVASIE
jgi:type II secretory ATPase GspE/PulE/Tfp pilus assembly ATPase PilB-like protein